MLVALLFMGLLVIILAMMLKMVDVLDDSNAKLEKVADELEKLRQVVNQVNQSTHLSETIKTIAFRDSDAQTLRDAVFDKLQQKDFDSAYEIIDEIAHRTGYKKLAEQLHVQADKYRDATDVERMNQSMAHIDKLLDDHQWVKASTQIERLVKEYPASDKVLEMRQRLAEKKDERKKVLLNAWDDAIKRQATDRSIEILRELDQYLTPNEGLALQEAQGTRSAPNCTISVCSFRWPSPANSGQRRLILARKSSANFLTAEWPRKSAKNLKFSRPTLSNKNSEFLRSGRISQKAIFGKLLSPLAFRAASCYTFANSGKFLRRAGRDNENTAQR